MDATVDDMPHVAECRPRAGIGDPHGAARGIVLALALSSVLWMGLGLTLWTVRTVTG